MLGRAHAVLVDFNTTGDLATNFTQNTNGTGGTFSQSASGGISNSGSVALSSGDGTTAVYTGGGSSFDLASSSPVTISLYFRVNATSTGSFIATQLGLVTSTTGDLRLASPYEALRVYTTSTAGTYQLLLLTQSTTGGTVTSAQQGSNFSLATGNWYQLTATFTSISATQLSVSGSIVDFGATGTTIGATITSFSGVNVTNAALAGDSSVYGAFRGNNASGISNYDNFSIVPEPSTCSMVAAGFLGLIYFRRKIRRASHSA